MSESRKMRYSRLNYLGFRNKTKCDQVNRMRETKFEIMKYQNGCEL